MSDEIGIDNVTQPYRSAPKAAASASDVVRQLLAEWITANPITGACAGCGEEVTRNAKRCFVCTEKAIRIAETRRAAASTIPAGFAFTRAGFDDAKVRACIRDAVALAKVKANALGAEWMLLRGVAGLGKSVSAAAVAWANAECEVVPRWVSALRLASAVARAPLGDEPDDVRLARDAALLVVDDLGSEPVIATSPILEVLHSRHEQGRRTCVTTWLDVAAIKARYGDGLARRLHERACVVDFKVRGTG